MWLTLAVFFLAVSAFFALKANINDATPIRQILTWALSFEMLFLYYPPLETPKFIGETDLLLYYLIFYLVFFTAFLADWTNITKSFKPASLIIIFSGIAAAASWSCYNNALKFGEVSQYLPSFGKMFIFKLFLWSIYFNVVSLTVFFNFTYKPIPTKIIALIFALITFLTVLWKCL